MYLVINCLKNLLNDLYGNIFSNNTTFLYKKQHICFQRFIIKVKNVTIHILIFKKIYIFIILTLTAFLKYDSRKGDFYVIRNQI